MFDFSAQSIHLSFTNEPLIIACAAMAVIATFIKAFRPPRK